MCKTAIVFSGQGAQFVGMGKDLAEAYPVCRELFEKADDVLGYRLSQLCFEGPLDQLTRSNHCQPAIFVTSIACFKTLQEIVPGFESVMMAGLSLGEWSALHAAGALSFEDTLKVLRVRGQTMQAACEAREGGMISVIGLAADALQSVCEQTGVEMANLNSPDQTVLSGPREAIAKAEAMAKELGAKRAIVLGVAGAFHSSLMAPATPVLEMVLRDVAISPTAVPVVANVTGDAHGDPDEIRRDMLAQVTGSVHWFKSIETMMAAGVTRFIECGPGKVLTGLIKRIASNAVLMNVQDVASLESAAKTLKD